MNPQTDQANQANVEYFFRLVYECFHGACYGPVSWSWLADLWVWITVIGYMVSVVALFAIVYTMVRLFELRKHEHHFYATPITPPQKESANNQRWAHIQELIHSETASQWREAIIEADILLDEVLSDAGFVGEGVGDKLRSASFGTIIDAGEAHGVRNRIAHEGSSFDLTASFAQRTIAKYENVFREFKAI